MNAVRWRTGWFRSRKATRTCSRSERPGKTVDWTGSDNVTPTVNPPAGDFDASGVLDAPDCVALAALLAGNAALP